MTAPAPGRSARNSGGEPGRDARRRHPSAAAAGDLIAQRDPLGKMALFSQAASRPFGSLFIECSTCGRETPTSALEAARSAIPSVHVPFRRYHSFMRCPACGRRTWVRLRWTLQ